jgi:hypothetical protein
MSLQQRIIRFFEIIFPLILLNLLVSHGQSPNISKRPAKVLFEEKFFLISPGGRSGFLIVFPSSCHPSLSEKAIN